MNNQELIQKMKKDMELRNFSKYTYDSYLGKTRYKMRYFGEKNLEDITMEELRIFLLEYLYSCNIRVNFCQFLSKSFS